MAILQFETKSAHTHHRQLIRRCPFEVSNDSLCSLESRHATIWSTKNCVCFLLDHHKPLLLEMVVGRFTYQEVYWRLQITSWDHSFLMVPPDNLLRNLTGYANKNICICLGTSMCTLEVNHHFKNDASFWMMINLYVIKKCGFFQLTRLKNGGQLDFQGVYSLKCCNCHDNPISWQQSTPLRWKTMELRFFSPPGFPCFLASLLFEAFAKKKTCSMVWVIW